MKQLINISSILLMLFVTAGMITSCKKDSSSGGTPVVNYVRITSPESSDSLLVGAGQGQLIAIVGDNLENAVEVWFNDQQSMLTPTYISKSSILVSLPTPIPGTITNMLTIVFKNGYRLEYPFEVQISEPLITSAECEYVPEGGTAVIHGNYFYAPITVTFAGGVTGEVEAIEEESTILKVKVPAGVQPGPITITTNFGESESEFWFNDNRNIFISSDPYEGWWNASYVVTNPGIGDPPKINGNYIRVTKFMGSWSWNEIAGGPATAMPLQSKNIPDDAILHPEDYNFKFEINTLKPYDGSTIRLNAALNSEDNNNYQWQPPYDSKGQWKTIVIPWEEMVSSYTVKPVVNPDGYWCRVLMQGPAELDCDICFDNFRIVPKVSE